MAMVRRWLLGAFILTALAFIASLAFFSRTVEAASCYPYDPHQNWTYDPPSVVIDWENPSVTRYKQFYKVRAAPCSNTTGVSFVRSVGGTGTPPLQGLYAARFSLTGLGDDTTIAHGDRADALLSPPQGRTVEGGETWLGWGVYFGPDFNINTEGLGTTAAKGGVIFSDVHQTNAATNVESSCGPIWQGVVDVKTNPISLRSQFRGGGKSVSTSNPCLTTTYNQVNIPFSRNVWHRFVMHAKWTYDDPANGLFELWHDGIKIQEVHGATLMDDKIGYFKLDNYRPVDWDQPSMVYHDALRRGDSYDEVAP